jgi:hypothetical protein
MKWKLLRLLDKSLMISLSYRPFRATLDHLSKWRDQYSVRVRQILLLCCLFVEFAMLLVSVWQHALVTSLVAGAFTTQYLLLIHQRRPREFRYSDEWSEPDDPSPTGDTVDSWLREKQRSFV